MFWGARTHTHTHTWVHKHTHVCEYDVVRTKHNHVWHVGRCVQCEWDTRARFLPVRAHFRADLYHSVSHETAVTHTDTYGDTSFSPRCSARLASPLQVQASRSDGSSLRLSASAGSQKSFTQSRKPTSDLWKTFKNDGIELGEVTITPHACFYFQLHFEALLLNALLCRSRRGLMDQKWVIITGHTQNNGGESTTAQPQLQGEPSKCRNTYFLLILPSELWFKWLLKSSYTPSVHSIAT